MDKIDVLVWIIGLIISGGIISSINQRHLQKEAVIHNAASWQADKDGSAVFVWNDELEEWRKEAE